MNKAFRALQMTAMAAVALVSAAGANAATIYESATYTGDDTGEYILTDYDFIGGVFSVSQTTDVTAIGAQFGGFPSGDIFGAIVPVGTDGVPAGLSTDLASIALGHVLFSVPTVTAIDLSVPLSLTLKAGTYAVIFGSGQFGATGFAGLGDLNSPSGDSTLIRSFFSDGWDSFSDNGVRVFVEGTTAAVPEPATWAIMLAGIGGAGAMLRRNRRQSALRLA